MGFLGLMLLLATMLQLLGVTCSLEQRYRQGALKTVLNHKLDDHQIRTLKGSTLLSCAHSCLAEPRCVSTNFGVSLAGNNLVCELNDRGASLVSGDELVYSKGFTFSVYSASFQSSMDMKVGFKALILAHDYQRNKLVMTLS